MKKRMLSIVAGLLCVCCLSSAMAAPAVKKADAELSVASAAAVTKPGTVTGLKATAAGKNRVKLTWNAVSGAQGYLVYGQKSGKYAYVGMTTQGTTFTDTKALDSDYNYYWVFAYVKDASGKMIPGGCEKYVFAKGICQAVTYLKASSTEDGVKLTWVKSNTAEGYLIYGKTDSTAYGYKGMTTGTAFIDTNAPHTEYSYYWVFPYHKDASGKMIVGGTAPYVYGKKILYKTYKLGGFTFQAYVKWDLETQSDNKTGMFAYVFTDPAGKATAVYQNVKKEYAADGKDPSTFDFYKEIGVLPALVGLAGYTLDFYTTDTIGNLKYAAFSASLAGTNASMRMEAFYNPKTYEMCYFLSATDQDASNAVAATFNQRVNVFFESITQI